MADDLPQQLTLVQRLRGKVITAGGPALFAVALLLTKSYLREALRLRTNSRPCSVAVAMTKLDTLFGSEQEAQAQLPAERLVEVLRPLVDMLAASDKVAHAAIFPVSAFGFGNAVVFKPAAGQPGRNGELPGSHAALESGELEWILKPGATPEPYNLMPLVVWSLLCGMLYREVEVEDDHDAAMARIGRLLAADLKALDGWQVALKGGLGSQH